MPLELNQLNAEQLNGLPRDKTVVFFSVGPIEDHGPHLPIGQDLLEAEKVCSLLAQKLENSREGWVAVLAPPAPLGIDSNTSALALTVRPHVLRDWLVDASRSLSRNGFRFFACYSGHPGPRQLTAIEEAGKLIHRGTLFGLMGKRQLISLSSALVDGAWVRKSPFWPDPKQHGGEEDTSIALAVKKEWVSPIAQSLPPRELEYSFLGRAWLRASRNLRGYWGAPAQASAEKGAATLEEKVNRIYERLDHQLDGRFAPSAFRSWYSVIPTNRSFFRAWITALMILVLLGFWASWALKGYS